MPDNEFATERYAEPLNPSDLGDLRRAIAEIRVHVVQLEALAAYVFLAIITTYLLGAAFASRASTLPLLLVPCALLVGLRGVIRVTNPTSAVRNSLTWAAVAGGVVGAVGGAVADWFTGGLSAGQGTLLGYAGGSVVGAAVGNRIENWGKAKDLVERGAAFDYLYQKRTKYPRVANPKLVDQALDHLIPAFDKNRDGRQWYAVDDLNRFLRAGSALEFYRFQDTEIVRYMLERYSVPASLLYDAIRNSNTPTELIAQLGSVVSKENQAKISDLIRGNNGQSELNEIRSMLNLRPYSFTREQIRNLTHGK